MRSWKISASPYGIREIGEVWTEEVIGVFWQFLLSSIEG